MSKRANPLEVAWKADLPARKARHAAAIKELGRPLKPVKLSDMRKLARNVNRADDKATPRHALVHACVDLDLGGAELADKLLACLWLDGVKLVWTTRKDMQP